ncbi:MAG: DUF4347 domain-containing protein, partial [Pirellulales bacterium]
MLGATPSAAGDALPTQAPQRRVALDASILEDRVLYSATLLPTEAGEFDSGSEVELSQEELQDMVLALFGPDPTITFLPSTGSLDSSLALDRSESSGLSNEGSGILGLQLPSSIDSIQASLQEADCSADVPDPAALDELPSSDIAADHALGLMDHVETAVESLLQDITQPSSSDLSSMVVDDPTAQLETSGEEARHLSVVFVQAGLQDESQLLDDLNAAGENGSDELLVIRLDNSLDGWGQISNALAGLDGIDSIHIISHGQDGAFQLGSTWIDASELETHQAELARWGMALEP